MRPDQLAKLDAEIFAAPKGPKIAAFFDFDGTLISGFSAATFVRDRIRRMEVSPSELSALFFAGLDASLGRKDMASVIAEAASMWKGKSEEELIALGEKLFRKSIASAVFPEARALVAAHQKMGHIVAIASSATRFQIAPLARDLGIAHILCTELVVKDGKLTGAIKGDVLWGEGKANAVDRFCHKKKLDLNECFGYANGDEDIFFLDIVGKPRPVNPAPALARHAREHEWPIRRFEKRGGMPSLTSVARTTAAIMGAGAAMGLGVGIGLLNRNRRDAANTVTSVGPELSLALAGVSLNITGEDNAWAKRPAVFIFNHQSGIDPMVVGAILKRDFTGVAKKELLRNPLIGPAGYLMGAAFVDRGNTDQAKKALEPVVEKLKSGTSIIIAPEGTRSPTPTPGPFKKGAFHMALQAGVPIVPIIIRNAGEIMWRDAMIANPGTIDVAILPPMDISHWSLSDLDAHVAKLRDIYVAALADWRIAEALARGDAAPRKRAAKKRAPKKAG